MDKKKGCAGFIAKKAVETKLKNLAATGTVTHPCFDALLFAKKIKPKLGGHVRLMLTGSAPIAGDVLSYLKCVFCSPICEGYGMTETCAASVLTLPFDPKAGHVGGPVANVKLKLRDIPEMGYLHTSKPPKGEICFFGPTVMKGYFKCPEKTAESLIDGWLHSGDVGMLNENGSLQLIDRAKNIFKTSQGEYIAPEKLENIYIMSEYLMQVWIHGDATKDWIMLFAVADPARMQTWAEAHGEKTFDAAKVPNAVALQKSIYEDVVRLADENDFSSLEKPKQIKVLHEAWTEDSGLLTPTMKLKRNVARVRFGAEIDKLYAAGPLQFKAKLVSQNTTTSAKSDK